MGSDAFEDVFWDQTRKRRSSPVFLDTTPLKRTKSSSNNEWRGAQGYLRLEDSSNAERSSSNLGTRKSHAVRTSVQSHPTSRRSEASDPLVYNSYLVSSTERELEAPEPSRYNAPTSMSTRKISSSPGGYTYSASTATPKVQEPAKIRSSPSGFDFSAVPTGPKNRPPAKTLQRLPKIHASSLDGPYIFINACYLPPLKTTVLHLKGKIQRCQPTNVLVDDHGYYIIFENTSAGRDRAKWCHEVFNNQLLFQQYPLVMERRSAYVEPVINSNPGHLRSPDIWPQGPRETDADSEARPERLRQKSLFVQMPRKQMRRDMREDSWPERGSNFERTSHSRAVSEAEPASTHTDSSARSHLPHCSPESKEDHTSFISSGRVNVTSEDGLPLLAPGVDHECHNLVTSVSRGENTTRAAPQNGEWHHAPENNTDALNKNCQWNARNNETHSDSQSSRLRSTFLPERNFPSDDGASMLSGATSSRASSALSDMLNPTCRKCKSTHSPSYNPLIKCSSCRRQFHGRCHKPPIPPEPNLRKCWQCNRCIKEHRPLPAPSSGTTQALHGIDDVNPRSGTISSTRVDSQGSLDRTNPLSGDGMITELCQSVPENQGFRDRTAATQPEYLSNDAASEFSGHMPSHTLGASDVLQGHSPVSVTAPLEHVMNDSDENMEPHFQDRTTENVSTIPDANDEREAPEQDITVNIETDPAAISTQVGPTKATPQETQAQTSPHADVASPSRTSTGTNAVEVKRSTDFIYDKNTKPPYRLEDLAGMALCEAPEFRLTAAQVFAWVSHHFPFYVEAGRWKITLGVYLSQKSLFQKQPRPAGDIGKGNYWCLNENVREHYSQLLAETRRQVHLEASNRCNNGANFGGPQDELGKVVDDDPTEFDISDNGYPHYKIVCKSPSGKEWRELSPLESVRVNDIECRVGVLVEYPCIPWHHKQDTGKPQLVSIGQVLDMRMSQDGRPLLHVLWYYRRAELQTIQCGNFKQWPPYCKWIKSTHVDIIFAKEVTGLMDPSTLLGRTHDFVLDFSVGVARGSMIRAKNHAAVRWLEDVFASLPGVEHESQAQDGRVSPGSSKIPVGRSDHMATLSHNSAAARSSDGLMAQEHNYQDNPRPSSGGSNRMVELAHIPAHNLPNVATSVETSDSNQTTDCREADNIPKVTTETAQTNSKARGTPEKILRAHGDAAASDDLDARHSAPTTAIADTNIKAILKDKLNNRKFLDATEYDPSPGNDLLSRLLQVKPKASGRYFKKLKPGRDCSYKLWPLENRDGQDTKESGSRANFASGPSAEAPRASGADQSYDHVDVEMVDQETEGVVCHKSFEELFGDGTDMEMILHEGQLAFREKATVRMSTSLSAYQDYANLVPGYRYPRAETEDIPCLPEAGKELNEMYFRAL